MTSPPRTPPSAAESAFDQMRDLIESGSGAVRRAPSGKGGDERPAGRAWGAASQQDVGSKSSQAPADLTSELAGALKEVVAVLDSREMGTFIARAFAQGDAYTGPKIDMERLRSLVAKAEGRGYSRKREGMGQDATSRHPALAPAWRADTLAGGRVAGQPARGAQPIELDEARAPPKQAAG